jgi:alpha-methylacyl-CoA racemase
MTGPLTSLRILDFTTLLPGPYATMLLADLGAGVVRVESPARQDIVRFKPPFRDGVAGWHGTLNRNKRSLALDLKQPGAAAVVRRLVAAYDIVLEQFRPGVMDRLGVGYESLRAANPRLIYCALTGYGQDGPYRDRAGHDIGYIALAGIAAHSGRAATGPPPLGIQPADIGAGSHGAVIAILAAALHRQLTGEGQFLDVSMFDGALAWNALAIADALAGAPPAPESTLLNGGTAYDYYATADGRYLAVGALEPKFWQAFCAAIERPDLAGTPPARAVGDQSALKAEIATAIAARPLAYWTERFAAVDACVEPVLTPAEAIAHPQAQARDRLVSVPHPGGAPQPQVAHPLVFSRTPPAYRHAGAPLGAHTHEVLLAAGFSAAEIAGLQEQGAIFIPGDDHAG